jgi:hypothetical protein
MQLTPGDRLADCTGEWEVVGRPYTTAGGENTHVRVQRVNQPGATEVKLWGSYEKVSVKQRRGRWIMPLARKATLLLALSLLTSTATAYAECAWVFWLEVSGPPTHESSSRPLSGWGTREACEQALTQRLAADSEKDISMDVTVDPQAGRPRLWVRRKGHPELLAVYTYVCLPDTVDPRGTKGK